MPPPAALRLAGFALAHAAWSVSEAPHSELLVPLVVLEDAGRREMEHFEAETQDEAIEEGRRAVARLSDKVDAWAFAREGTLRLGDGDSTQDVLVVEFWGAGMDEPYALIQPYRRSDEETPFGIVGEPIVTRGGEVIAPGATREIAVGVREGIREHTAAAGLWSAWQE